MKKLVIPVVIILLCGIGFLVYILSMSYNRVQYKNDTSAHFMDVDTGGELIAEHNGIETKVLGQNVFRIKNAITVSEMKRINSMPEYNSDTAIKLKFSDGAMYVIADDGSEDDIAFIMYSYKGKNQYFKIEGYKTYSWIERAVSPEGIYHENKVIQ